MSIEKISKEPKVLEARRTVVVTQDLSTIGSGMFIVDLQQYQLDFIPTRMVLRQVAYANLLNGAVLGGDQGIFTIYCSLSRQAMAFVTVGPLGITATTEQVINIPTFARTIEFQVLCNQSTINFDIATQTAQQITAPTGFIAMSLEFF